MRVLFVLTCVGDAPVLMVIVVNGCRYASVLNSLIDYLPLSKLAARFVCHCQLKFTRLVIHRIKHFTLIELFRCCCIVCLCVCLYVYVCVCVSACLGLHLCLCLCFCLPISVCLCLCLCLCVSAVDRRLTFWVSKDLVRCLSSSLEWTWSTRESTSDHERCVTPLRHLSAALVVSFQLVPGTQ